MTASGLGCVVRLFEVFAHFEEPLLYLLEHTAVAVNRKGALPQGRRIFRICMRGKESFLPYPDASRSRFARNGVGGSLPLRLYFP